MIFTLIIFKNDFYMYDSTNNIMSHFDCLDPNSLLLLIWYDSMLIHSFACSTFFFVIKDLKMKSGFLIQGKDEKEYSLAGPLKDKRSLGSQWSQSIIGGSNGKNARNGGGWGCSQTKTKDGWKSTSKSHGWRDSIEDHSSENWN